MGHVQGSGRRELNGDDKNWENSHLTDHVEANLTVHYKRSQRHVMHARMRRCILVDMLLEFPIVIYR
jgi:hypothetical protein